MSCAVANNFHEKERAKRGFASVSDYELVCCVPPRTVSATSGWKLLQDRGSGTPAICPIRSEIPATPLGHGCACILRGTPNSHSSTVPSRACVLRCRTIIGSVVEHRRPEQAAFREPYFRQPMWTLTHKKSSRLNDGVL